MGKFLFLLSAGVLWTIISVAQPAEPLRIGIAGLSHDHVHWILGYEGEDIEIVGIAEPDTDLAKRFAEQYGFGMDIVYKELDDLIAAQKPTAVAAFASIFEHLEVVQKCAPKGIHVMVEKPLAVNMEHARQMADLAGKYNIHLITNYETTWYPSNHEVYAMVEEEKLGPVRKIVVHDGHEGPAEIGVSEEFFSWLTDPLLNGGGAVVDFGCYGANLITWLMEGEKPLSVTAVTQQIKPEVYPKVDDEATVILTYPEAQGIIQASWNWPFSRKDMEVYGKTGYAIAANSKEVRYRHLGEKKEAAKSGNSLTAPYDNPFSYFASIINGSVEIRRNDLSSLEINMTVVEILDAATRSANTGQTVYLKDKDD